jgi:hypothetical protein
VKLLKKVGGIHDRVEAKLNLDPREEDLNGIPYGLHQCGCVAYNATCTCKW